MHQAINDNLGFTARFLLPQIAIGLGLLYGIDKFFKVTAGFWALAGKYGWFCNPEIIFPNEPGSSSYHCSVSPGGIPFSLQPSYSPGAVSAELLCRERVRLTRQRR